MSSFPLCTWLNPSLLERVSDQFRSAGDCEFSEQTEEMVLDGMLAEFQLKGNVAVGFSGNHQGYDLLLPLGERDFAAGVSPNARALRLKRLEQLMYLIVVCPYLSFVHLMDTLAQNFAGIVSPTDSACAPAKRVKH